MATSVLLDDRLLIEELLVGLPRRRAERTATTASWYYRACRAAVVGAAGHLSGPFAQLERRDQEAAVLSLLTLRDDIGLPDPRRTVPAMARLAARHPRLNLLNLEAAGAAQTMAADVWLSEEAAKGVLPSVLDAESIPWTTIERK